MLRSSCWRDRRGPSPDLKPTNGAATTMASAPFFTRETVMAAKTFNMKIFALAEAALEGTHLSSLRRVEKLADVIAETVEDFIDREQCNREEELECALDDDEIANSTTSNMIHALWRQARRKEGR
jgi:hypothetical protein